MPTVGWIQEGDIEAFLAATENIAGPGHAPPPTPVFRCPFCEKLLGSEQMLQAHIAAEHYVSRPVLYLNGLEAPQEITVRSSIASKSFVVANAVAAELSVDGYPSEQVSLGDISKKLSELRNSEAKLTLTNVSGPKVKPVSLSYNIIFRIAHATELIKVEAAFFTKIKAETMTRAAIDTFLRHPACAGPARDYALGLGNYCLGILQKERPSSDMLTTPFAQYRESYVEARQKLSEVARPLAHLIAGTIRFALNDFSSSNLTGYWELDVAAAALRDPSAPLPEKPADGSGRTAYPVDHGTGQIIDLANRLLTQERWSPILDGECRQTADSPALDAMDRDKALALWAISAWRLGAREHAVEPLQRISATYPFRTWAEPFLETVTQ